MTTWRLMDGVSGRPGIGSTGTQPPASQTAGTGTINIALTFKVTQGGKYFNGYWKYVPASGDISAANCALWQITGTGTGQVIPATEVSGATGLVAGQWNFIACNPIPLTPNIPYAAVFSYSMASGYARTQNQFGASQPYAAGITNGPLTAYSSATGTNPLSGWVQSPLSTGTAIADAGFYLPTANDLDDLLWLDVQVTDVVPSGTPERAWPNMTVAYPAATGQSTAKTLGTEFTLSQPADLKKIWHYSPNMVAAGPYTGWKQAIPTGLTVGSSGPWTLGMEFDVTVPCFVNRIWYYSGPGAALPTSCAIYANGNTTALEVQATPTWSGAAGSGWVYATLSGTTQVNPGTAYYSALYFSGAGWNYNSSWGPTNLGVANGPLVIPYATTAARGQGVLHNGGASITYPETSWSNFNVQTDVSVTPVTVGSMPTRCGIWNATSLTEVAGTDNSSPTWLNPDTSPFIGPGWAYCDYSQAGVTLAKGNFAVATFNGAGTAQWYAETASASPSFTHDIIQFTGTSFNATTWAYPATSASGASDWVDVEVVPNAGTWTVFKQGTTATLTADPTSYTLGMQFSTSQVGQARAVWFYSPPGAAVLPQTIGIYQVTGTGTGTLVASQAASWSGAAGSGWVRAAFTTPPTLATATNYKVVVLQNTNVNWYSSSSHYWDTTGAGANGLASGPITAPNNAGADVGQCSFVNTSTLNYPNQTFNAANYLIDIELGTDHYRVMDGQAGRPGNGPTTAVSYSGNYICGLAFEALQGGTWFEGYWWWVCPTGGLTAPQKFVLWSHGAPSGGATNTGTIVPGTTVTSGTLTTGWNYIPLTTPVLLAQGWTYIGATGVNGNFPESKAGAGTGAVDSFGTGGHTAGIRNGPLFAFSDAANGGTNQNPWGSGQAVFSTGGSDPAVTIPLSADASGNLWLDVQVTTTAPAGYSGSYRAWPNVYQGTPYLGGDGSFNYIVGSEIHLSQSCSLNKIWYHSPSGSTQLATSCDVWNVATGANVATNASPTWSGAAGSGWVSCSFTGVTLPAGRYYVTVYNGAATPTSWSAKQLYYTNFGDGAGGYPGQSPRVLSTGPTFDGIRHGPVHWPTTVNASKINYYNSTPNLGGPAPAQAIFAVGPPNQIPIEHVKGLGQSYWVDMEVTPAAGNVNVAGAVANVAVAAPVGTESVSVAGATGAVTVAAPVGSESVSLAGAATAVTVAAPLGTFTTSVVGGVAALTVNGLPGTSKVTLTGQVGQVSVVAPVGIARGTTAAKGGLFLAHFP